MLSQALATRRVAQKCGKRKVLIVDWDIHHGNGIQHAFVDDPSVLYFSVHRYEKGEFFPAGCPTSPVHVPAPESQQSQRANPLTVYGHPGMYNYSQRVVPIDVD